MADKKTDRQKVRDENKSAATDKFAASTGDEDFLNLNKKPDLTELATVINKNYDAAMGYADKAKQLMMEVGAHLLVARKQFKGDNEFGKWRKKNINFGQSHCQRLMAVAKKFKGQETYDLPVSTLAELISAPESVKEEVIKQASEGAKPTRAAVKEMKKVSVFNEEVEIPVKSEMRKVVSHVSPEEKAQAILDLPFRERIDKVDPWKGGTDASFLLFGIPPFHDGTMSQDTLELIYRFYSTNWEDHYDVIAKIEKAYEVLMGMYD